MILGGLWGICKSVIKTSHLTSIMKFYHNALFIPQRHMPHLLLEFWQQVTWFIQQWRYLLFVWRRNGSPADFMPLQHLPSPLPTSGCHALHKEHSGHRLGPEKHLNTMCQYIIMRFIVGRNKTKSTSKSKSWSLFSYLENKGVYFMLVFIKVCG